jgi:hypothetical protein
MTVLINGELNINENAMENENIEVINEIENNEYDYYTIQIMNDFINYYNYHKIMNEIYNTIIFLVKHPYLLYIYVLMSDLFNNCIDNIILFKLFIEKNINELLKFYIVNNQIENIYLISDTKFLLINNINKLNKEIFEEIFRQNNCELNDDSSILIKYKYEGKKYRLYINYRNIEENIYDFPLNIEQIQENIEKKYNRSTILFFKNECNEIKEARINDIDIKEIIEECNGPFYDFGLIHNHKVYIKHLVKELGIRLDEFRELEIKYTNYYMDEIDMVLIEHVINIKDKDDYIQSGIINKKLI